MKLTMDSKVQAQGVSLAYSVIRFKNEAYNEQVWQELLTPLIQTIEAEDSTDTIKEDPQIIAAKKVYRTVRKRPRPLQTVL